MADGPQFGMFVRSVPGHVVQRYGSTELIGATRRPLTKAQKLDGESPIEWNDAIVPLTKDYCRRYARELDGHLRAGELAACTREDWEAQGADEQKRLDEPQAQTKAPSAGKRSK